MDLFGFDNHMVYMDLHLIEKKKNKKIKTKTVLESHDQRGTGKYVHGGWGQGRREHGRACSYHFQNIF